ncbi:MAG TPA: VIT1/CCC1 transporter family protein [Acidimicrobiales bacterium]
MTGTPAAGDQHRDPSHQPSTPVPRVLRARRMGARARGGALDTASAGRELHDVHHRDIAGGAARAAVFGVSDGLVSNVGLILGVAGADPQPGVVRLAGLAGLIAGGISMAAGEYISMRVQSELFERELAVEARELRRHPRAETAELAQIYERRGLSTDEARRAAEAMMSDPETALEAHARDELGIDPGQLGSPHGAAVSSFFSFGIGALLPLLPWFFGGGTAAIVASLAFGVAGALVVGGLISAFTGRPPLRAMVRQVLFTLVPAAVTFAIGSALGVGVT